MPGNPCTPTYLGETARKLERAYKTVKVQVMDRKQIEALGMGAFLSVARGSDEPPRFIVLRHAGKPARKSRQGQPPARSCWWARALPSTRAASPSSRPPPWTK